MPSPVGRVVSVSRDDRHRFTKPTTDRIRLVEGWGVDGDAHARATVQHRSRSGRVSEAPNLRQVHLLHGELFDDVANRGYRVTPGDIGECRAPSPRHVGRGGRRRRPACRLASRAVTVRGVPPC